MIKKISEKLAIVALLVYGAGIIFNISRHDDYQWDFWIYYNSVRAHAAGLNPYEASSLSQIVGSPMRNCFAYPPLALYFFRPFIYLDFATASYLYLFLKCLLLSGLLYLWKKEFLQDKADTLFYFFCLLAFNAAIYIDFAAGNVSLLEQFLLWSAFAFYLKRRWLLFSLCVVAAASFKLVPILFLGLLWFADEKKRYWYFAGGCAGFGIMLLASYLVAPTWFVEFVQDSVGRADWEHGLLNPSTLSFIRDAHDLLAAKFGIVISLRILRALFLALAAIVLLISYRAHTALRPVFQKHNEKVLIFLACLVYALILPRFKDYSYILLIPPAYFILKKLGEIKATLLLGLTVLYLPNPMGGILPLPGFEVLTKLVTNYFPLLMAYGVWGLYLYDILIRSAQTPELEMEAVKSDSRTQKGAPPWQETNSLVR